MKRASRKDKPAEELKVAGKFQLKEGESGLRLSWHLGIMEYTQWRSVGDIIRHAVQK